MLAEQLVNFEATLQPELKLAYLPQYGMVKLRITATGQDQLVLKQAIDSKFEELKRIVATHLVSDKDEKLEAVIGAELVDELVIDLKD